MGYLCASEEGHAITKRGVFLAEQGTQLGEQSAGRVPGPRLTPLHSPLHEAQNAQRMRRI